MDRGDKDFRDYAERQAWNNFVDSGTVEDYNRYNEIKEDLEDSKYDDEKEEEIEND